MKTENRRYSLPIFPIYNTKITFLEFGTAFRFGYHGCVYKMLPRMQRPRGMVVSSIQSDVAYRVTDRVNMAGSTWGT